MCILIMFSVLISPFFPYSVIRKLNQLSKESKRINFWRQNNQLRILRNYFSREFDHTHVHTHKESRLITLIIVERIYSSALTSSCLNKD